MIIGVKYSRHYKKDTLYNRLFVTEFPHEKSTTKITVENPNP